jgi:hypothetical protein
VLIFNSGRFLIGLALHLLLLLLLLHDQPLLFPDPALAAHVEGDDGQQDEEQPDDAPGDDVVGESQVGYPVNEADHDAQDTPDDSDHEDGVHEHFAGREGVVLIGNAFEVRPVSAHRPYVLVLPQVLGRLAPICIVASHFYPI